MQLPRLGKGGRTSKDTSRFHSPRDLSLLPIPLARPLPAILPRVSAALQGLNTPSVFRVMIRSPFAPNECRQPGTSGMPEHMALSVPPGKPLGAWHGAGSEGTAVPYPARPAPRGSGRWPREPAARTGGAGSGGTRCGAEAWAGRNLGMQKITAEHPAQRDPLPTITTCPPQPHAHHPAPGWDRFSHPAPCTEAPRHAWGWREKALSSSRVSQARGATMPPPNLPAPLSPPGSPLRLPGGQLLFSLS